MLSSCHPLQARAAVDITGGLQVMFVDASSSFASAVVSKSTLIWSVRTKHLDICNSICENSVM